MFLVFSEECIIMCLKEGDEVKYHDTEITVKKRKYDNGRVEYWFDGGEENKYCLNIYDVDDFYALIYEDNDNTEIHFVRKDLVNEDERELIENLRAVLNEIKREKTLSVDIEKLVKIIIDCINAWKEMFNTKKYTPQEIMEAHYPEPSPV